MADTAPAASGARRVELRLREILGFNAGTAKHPVLQPLWFDLTGMASVIGGGYLLYALAKKGHQAGPAYPEGGLAQPGAQGARARPG